MAVIDHITTNNSATYEIQDTVARTKSNNLESTNYTDIGGGFADGNTLLVKTDNGMKKGFLNNFANWILDKLATKVYNQLATSNKTIIGALNELNSNKVGQNEIDNVYISDVKDLNNPPRAFILNTGVNPIGLPPQLYSNGCLVIQHNPSDKIYTAQLAFSFGSDKIAIRRKAGTDSWSEWKYFTSQ